jgi:ABC-type polysaccharide/polyol phosphate transport system ATPase subunit
LGKKAIHISNLGKTYILDEKFKQNFREKIVSNSNQVQIVQALKNINLSIEKGEVVGILGDNGSGKSTLLKLISGITRPSLGTIEIHGKVASILEVGTGFNPELSGRENIYFSGEVLGMKRKELKNLEAKIIAFSEIKDFIDMQVKYYSSGMFMRLAFSVVAHVDADIILLDEVFSVGDASFRRKSEARIKEMANSEKTVIVVSHDLSSLSKLCSRFVWLEKRCYQSK